MVDYRGLQARTTLKPPRFGMVPAHVPRFKAQGTTGLNTEKLLPYALILIAIQLVGMILANLVSALDRHAGIRWLRRFSPRPRVRWGLAAFLIIWCGLSFVQVLLGNLLQMLPTLDDPSNRPLRALLAVSIGNGLCLLVVPAILGPGWRKGAARLGLAGPDLKRQASIGLRTAWLVSPWVYAVNVAATLVFKPQSHAVMQMLKQGLSQQTMLLAALSAVVFAPLAEELLFRGVLLGGLIRKTRRTPASQRRRPVQLANVFTSLFFALLHADAWPAPIGIFVLSLALGKLYIATGRLWPCIMAHAVFNLTGVVGMFAAVGIEEMKRTGQLSYLMDPFYGFFN